jgi:hypothetical protein
MAAEIVPDAFVSLRELSPYAGLSVRQLRRCLTDRTDPLPHYRLRGKILVRRREFDAWVAHFRRLGQPVSATCRRRARLPALVLVTQITQKEASSRSRQRCTR